MAREENNTSQQKAPKVMNENQFNFEFDTTSKIRVKPFSEKLLSAFENEKIIVYAEETIFTNRISRE